MKTMKQMVGSVLVGVAIILILSVPGFEDSLTGLLLTAAAGIGCLVVGGLMCHEEK